MIMPYHCRTTFALHMVRVWCSFWLAVCALSGKLVSAAVWHGPCVV